MNESQYDTVIIGAGAAGMFCAAQAGARGGRVLVIEHARTPGEKIRISGGGRCNFTNLNASAANFISQNPHFAKSALGRYSPQDFLALLSRHRIAWHEKTLGQLFCDGSARQIVAMLLEEMDQAGVQVRLQASVAQVRKTEYGFGLELADGSHLQTRNLVIASGGKSIPKMGASGFGYTLARQFGLPIVPTRPGLVPLTFDAGLMAGLKPLAGVSLPVRVTCGKVAFEEALLVTHRGLSGPAILQISSYWHEGEEIGIDLLPGGDAFDALRRLRGEMPRRSLATAFAMLMPKRLAQHLADRAAHEGPIGAFSDKALRALAQGLHRWRLLPAGTEGYRTAEVTVGGVDTAALSSKTMQARAVPGLYFIGEVVDVTGWLGGYNFQWAWASGWAAGQAIAGA